MANRGPGTSGSQFFFVQADAELIPNRYTPFGTVTRGKDIVDQVIRGGHDNAYSGGIGGGRPKAALVIQSVTVTGP